MARTEMKLLSSWKLKISIIIAIITPSVTVTGAYFKVQAQVQEAKAQADQRMSAVELSAQKSFAEKTDLKNIQTKIDEMHDDIVEIKSILKRR